MKIKIHGLIAVHGRRAATTGTNKRGQNSPLFLWHEIDMKCIINHEIENNRKHKKQLFYRLLMSI